MQYKPDYKSMSKSFGEDFTKYKSILSLVNLFSPIIIDYHLSGKQQNLPDKQKLLYTSMVNMYKPKNWNDTKCVKKFIDEYNNYVIAKYSIDNILYNEIKVLNLKKQQDKYTDEEKKFIENTKVFFKKYSDKEFIEKFPDGISDMLNLSYDELNHDKNLYDDYLNHASHYTKVYNLRRLILNGVLKNNRNILFKTLLEFVKDFADVSYVIVKNENLKNENFKETISKTKFSIIENFVFLDDKILTSYDVIKSIDLKKNIIVYLDRGIFNNRLKNCQIELDESVVYGSVKNTNLIKKYTLIKKKA